MGQWGRKLNRLLQPPPPPFPHKPQSRLNQIRVWDSSSTSRLQRSMATSALLLLLIPPLFLLASVAGSEGISDAFTDPCGTRSDGVPASCPASCFLPDPVCGTTGITYWCGCPEAACAGARVAKRGPCQIGSGGSGLVSGQAFLLLHIVWLIVLGFSVLCGLL